MSPILSTISQELGFFTYNPRIVKNGLILYLDAGQTSSYNGGTRWRDLSGYNTYGDLTNGPIYTSSNGGGFTLDGTDDYVNLQVLGAPVNTTINNFCYDVWCLPTSTITLKTESTSGTAGTNGQKYLIGPQQKTSPDAGSGISLGTNGVSFYELSSSYMPPLLVYGTTISSPVHVVINYTNKTPSLYLNGQFIKNGLTSTRTNIYPLGEYIGRHLSYGAFNGDIYSVKYYNRPLTSTEVLQNFEALRGRYKV